MAATGNNKLVDYYVTRGTKEAVRAGDCVFMKSLCAPSTVAHVEKLEADSHGNVEFQLRWYYKPEHTVGGRRSFHGAKELFLSDHYDTRSASIIIGKCTVYSLKQYAKLKHVGPKDFYSRFEYRHVSGTMAPVAVRVFCKCEMPDNPDKLMLPCSNCHDRFHPMCIGMTLEQTKQLTLYLCDDCSHDDYSLSSQYAQALMDANKNDAAHSKIGSSVDSSASSQLAKGLKRASGVDVDKANPILVTGGSNLKNGYNVQDTLGDEVDELGGQVEGMDENEVLKTEGANFRTTGQ